MALRFLLGPYSISFCSAISYFLKERSLFLSGDEKERERESATGRMMISTLFFFHLERVE